MGTKKTEITLDCAYDNYSLLSKDNLNIKKYTNSDITIRSEYNDILNLHNDKKQSTKILFTENEIYDIDLCRYDEIISIRRVHDLIMLKNIISVGLNVPQFYYTSGRLKYLELLNFDKTYVIKSFLQARSVGKAIVKVDEYLDMCYTSIRSDITREEFNKRFIKFKGEYRNEHEEYLIYKNITSAGDFYMQEYIDVKAEYRLFYTYGTELKDLILLKRTGYGLTNDITVDNMKTIKIDNPENILSDSMVSKFKDLSKLTKLPIMSVDIYEDNNGDFGIFEYSPEFSLELDINTLKQLKTNINLGMMNFLKELI